MRISDLKARLEKEGITWFQFIFQTVIVLISIILALYLGDIAAAQSEKNKLHLLIVDLKEELTEDVAQIQKIIDLQKVKHGQFHELHSWLDGRIQMTDSYADSLMMKIKIDSETFFPRKAVYSTLLNGGYFSAFEDVEVPTILADYYEKRYHRIVYNGELHDRFMILFFSEDYGHYWDRAKKRPMKYPSIDKTVFHNAALTTIDNIEFYLSLLEETKEAMVHILQILEKKYDVGNQ